MDNRTPEGEINIKLNKAMTRATDAAQNAAQALKELATMKELVIALEQRIIKLERKKKAE